MRPNLRVETPPIVAMALSDGMLARHQAKDWFGGSDGGSGTDSLSKWKPLYFKYDVLCF